VPLEDRELLPLFEGEAPAESEAVGEAESVEEAERVEEGVDCALPVPEPVPLLVWELVAVGLPEREAEKDTVLLALREREGLTLTVAEAEALGGRLPDVHTLRVVLGVALGLTLAEGGEEADGVAEGLAAAGRGAEGLPVLE